MKKKELEILFEKGAAYLDQEDPLKDYAQLFHQAKSSKGENLNYFCGHSLGLQPRSASKYVEQVLNSWRSQGVKGHFSGDAPWMHYHNEIASVMAGMAGARSSEVTLMNTLTVNLHLMMVSFYSPTPSRHKILVEEGLFPSDRYAIESQLKWHGLDPKESLVVMSSDGKNSIDDQDILNQIADIGDELALVLFGGVNYLTGQLFDMASIAAKGHEVGALVGFDLAHAFANVPVQLHDWNVDFAVWCTYKYFNGGPGSLGGCFVHEKHHQSELPRMAGWWGQELKSRFLMPDDFRPAAGVESWQISNAPILSMAPLRASAGLFAEVGMHAIREKSKLLTGFAEYRVTNTLGDLAEIISPKEPSRRGSQLSIRIQNESKSLIEKLEAESILCDWREPDVLRIAPVPLYNSFKQVDELVKALELLTK